MHTDNSNGQKLYHKLSQHVFFVYLFFTLSQNSVEPYQLLKCLVHPVSVQSVNNKAVTHKGVSSLSGIHHLLKRNIHN